MNEFESEMIETMNDFEFEVLTEMVNEMNQKLLAAHRAINIETDTTTRSAANFEYKRMLETIRALTESLEGTK